MDIDINIGTTVLVTWTKGRCVGVVKAFRIINWVVWVKVEVKNGYILVKETQCKAIDEGFKSEGVLDL